MQKIPFDPSRSADQTFQLLIPERMVATIRMVWNGRANAWSVSVSTESGKIEGLRLRERWPLFYEHKALSPIEGDIIALPSSGNAGHLSDYFALGRTWNLFWLSPEDLSRWEAANGLG